jgi:hypothetical protein
MDGKHEMRCLSVLTLGEVLCGIGWSWLLQQDPLFVDLSYTEKCKVSAVVPSCDTGSTSLSFVDEYKTPAIVTPLLPAVPMSGTAEHHHYHYTFQQDA